ncbi:hypothetical protein [Aegicerativicinus sediminis]
MNSIKGEIVNLYSESYYKISNSDKMRPFFMSVVSDSNHWMYISSNGGLTAGRKNADYSLFPYYTDDKLTEMAETTGHKAIFRVNRNGKISIWEPFSIRQSDVYKLKSNLYKSIYGNKIVFEEINEDLELTYRYQWSSSNKFGFRKRAELINNSEDTLKIRILDGLQNILPSNVNSELQNSRSNLVDAYKKNELQKDVGLGIYTLSAVIVDKAEPSEALKANTVWSAGLTTPTYLLSSLQLENFRNGIELINEIDVRAEKGAYFISTEIELESGETKSWIFVANVNQTISDVIRISDLIKKDSNLVQSIQEDVELGTKNLIQLVGASDGVQKSQDTLINIRHFSNTLFNIMRGGIFDNGYTIEKEDLIKYFQNANKILYEEKEILLRSLPESLILKDLHEIANNDSNRHFTRLCLEYLPLKFSRRHGDPSRPWNRFSINTQNESDGSKILDYEGNWRDIFQNWEALALSFPLFIEGMIHKFLNASTFEGYNPYRITKDGFDWEIIEEHDPWSYIGYWGDHQIIYLLKLLELANNHNPNTLENLVDQDLFVYANVPYVIKTYEEIVKNPKDTIDFNRQLDFKLREEREKNGADGCLIKDNRSNIYYVNLIEKLLVTVLAKISNFIPEGGIWLNTQRPEWNDVNNALVGNGVSMVTLYYLHRFLIFFDSIVKKSSHSSIEVSKELNELFKQISQALDNHRKVLAKGFSDKDRKSLLDILGKAASEYRGAIYKNGFSGNKTTLNLKDVSEFIQLSNSYLKQSISVNKRKDKMYHAYNLMNIENEGEISISYLTEMLEGQVAVLSSGFLSPDEALELLDSLKHSSLFRKDQYSYLLYPNKELPRFDKKNNIPSNKIEGSKLLKQLLEEGDRSIIEQDINGGYHFNGNFNNSGSLQAALNQLDTKFKKLVDSEAGYVMQIFEDVFNHKSFTGRSGTFFAYEGLGSIYWHMVSKLLLAVQENCFLAINNNFSAEVIGRLLEHYYEIKAGIGVHKPPKLYGAFPTDPYSHTPSNKGAQQPGMTGQVKEDILCRFGELGVFVVEGKIQFNPRLLQSTELLNEPSVFNFLNVKGQSQQISLNADSIGFTYCQVPIIYQKSSNSGIEIRYNSNESKHLNDLFLDLDISRSIFERKGLINQIIVSVTL